MAEQIITNKDKLKFYSEKEYNYNWDKDLKEHRTLYAVLYPIAHVLVDKIKFNGVEVYGTENIPTTGKVLLASNHASGFDPITIVYAMSRDRRSRTMYFMAKEEFFHTFYTKWPLLILNGFPVKRGTSDRKSLNFAIRTLKENFALLIFPQGTRDKELGRPDNEVKNGVALIVREAQTPVLPVSIHIEKNPANGKAPHVVVRFGKLIEYSDFGFSEKAKSAELKAATKLIMDRICEEWDKDNVK